MRYRFLPELTKTGGQVLRMGRMVPSWAANLGYLHISPYKAKELLNFRGYQLSEESAAAQVDYGAPNQSGGLSYYRSNIDNGGFDIVLDQPLLVDGISQIDYTNQFLFEPIPAGYQKDYTRPAWYSASLTYWHLELSGYQEKLQYGFGDMDLIPHAVASASAEIFVSSNKRPLKLYVDYWMDYRTTTEVEPLPNGATSLLEGASGLGASKVRVYMNVVPDGDEIFTVTYNRTHVVEQDGKMVARYLQKGFRETLNLEPTLSPMAYSRLTLDAWNDHYSILSGRVYVNLDSERFARNELQLTQLIPQHFQLQAARKGYAGVLEKPQVQGVLQGGIVRFFWPAISSYDPREHRFVQYRLTIEYPNNPGATPREFLLPDPFFSLRPSEFPVKSTLAVHMQTKSGDTFIDNIYLSSDVVIEG